MARLELRDDLDELAARMVRDRLGRIAGEVRNEAQHRAPAAKQWVTARDSRVRPSHRHADGQTIPANLHYRLRRMRYVRRGRSEHGRAVNPGGGWREIDGYDLAQFPRDPDLPMYQRLECRCRSIVIPGAISHQIHVEAVRVEGPRAVAKISVIFARITEAEFGTSVDRGDHFMARAAAAVARRVR